MMKAVAEVKSLPNYATSGEVRIHLYNYSCNPADYSYSNNSFDSEPVITTLDMTRRPMPFIQLSLACLEGNYM